MKRRPPDEEVRYVSALNQPVAEILNTGPLAFVRQASLSHLPADVQADLAVYAQTDANDTLVAFIRAATISRFVKRGFVAVLDTALYQDSYLRLQQVAEQNPFRQKRTLLAAGLGSQYPLQILEVRQTLDWLKDYEPDSFQVLRTRHRMTSPASLYDHILSLHPQTLVVGADVRGPVSQDDILIGRYILRAHLERGCAVLLMVAGGITQPAQSALLKDFAVFSIGRF